MSYSRSQAVYQCNQENWDAETNRDVQGSRYRVSNLHKGRRVQISLAYLIVQGKYFYKVTVEFYAIHNSLRAWCV